MVLGFVPGRAVPGSPAGEAFVTGPALGGEEGAGAADVAGSSVVTTVDVLGTDGETISAEGGAATSPP